MTNLERVDGLAPKPIWEGVAGREIRGERMTLAVVELDPGALVPDHRHANEQLGLCLAGSVTFTIGDETEELGPGGTWRIPGDTPHTVRAGDDGAVVVDVFAPPRHDWDELPADPPRPPRWP